MNKLYLIPICALLCSSLYAKEEEFHNHMGSSNIKLNYETLDFTNSKKKEDGIRYGIEFDHQNIDHHYQIYYEKSKTNTTKIVSKDLDVNKYTLKYQYKLTLKDKLSFSYTDIDDNLMKETNNGHIYGIAYQRGSLGLSQYFSNYNNFNVYQTDLKYSLKTEFENFTLKSMLITKYIYLKDKNSNAFSKKAKRDYLTTGLKLHAHYNGYHLGTALYLGKRIFAVMKEGFKVQHHAMEFKNSFLCGIGHSLGNNLVGHLRYSYHKAKEVPSNNDDVKVENISFDIIYKF